MSRQKEKINECTAPELLENIYTSIIYYSLNSRLYENAVWFAERMCGEFPLSQKATYLLGLSYYRSNDKSTCASLLFECETTNKTILQLLWSCLFELKRYQEAQKVLVALNDMEMEDESVEEIDLASGDHISDSCQVSVHDSSVTCLWKASLLQNTGRRSLAINYFTEALAENPFLWIAVHQMSELGVPLKDTKALFGADRLKEAYLKYIHKPVTLANEKEASSQTYSTVFKQLGVVLQHSAEAFNLMKLFKPHDALCEFEKLPPNHVETPWVVAQMALLKTEMNDLRGAKLGFQKLMKMAPYRVKDLDYYSSLLWRLKHDIELSHLAHHLAKISSEAPETWIAVGNLMSLSGQSANAIRSLEHASDLAPQNAYILFLLGKEKVALNPSSKSAQTLFQTATRLEPRQWRAWHALGDMERNAGEDMLALAFYEKSIEINSSNPALYLSMAEIFKRKGQMDEALEMVESGLQLDKTNVVLLFKKAYYLALLGRPQESLDLLKVLESSVARHEVNLYYLMGKMHEQLGNEKDALRAYIQAMDISRAFASTHGGVLQSTDIFSGVPGLATSTGIQTEEGKVSAAAIMGAAFAVEGPGSRTSAVLDKIKEAIDRFGGQLANSGDVPMGDKSTHSFQELEQLPS